MELHDVDPQVVSPIVVDGVKSVERKFRPLTVRVGPPDIATLVEIMAVKTGASKVIRPRPVPTSCWIVSPTFWVTPYPARDLHVRVVDDDQDDVVQTPLDIVRDVVRSSATKFKPNTVR
jgi:hypothetical protein